MFVKHVSLQPDFRIERGADRQRIATQGALVDEHFEFDAIEIEMRSADEMLAFGGKPTVVAGAKAWNPVFDVTPAALIDVIVTERGVVEQPNAERMKALFGAAR